MTDTPTQPQQPTGGVRRWALVGTGGVAVVAVIGGAAWAVSQLVATGASPATAVPADALAYVALDLDPGAGQKVEALRTLNRFPALAERLGDRDELKSALVQAVLSEAPCDDLTVEGIERWLGDRMAVAVLPGEDKATPVVTVQVSGEAAAREGVQEVVACGNEGDDELPGMAFLGDYMVLAEDDATAQAAADAAEQEALDGADGYGRWVEEAGGPGILTGYLAPGAPAALAEEWGFGSGMPMGGMADPAQVEEAMADFEGAAFALRFAGGGIEAEAAGHAPDSPTAGGDNGLAALPDSTGVAVGMGVSEGFAEDLVELLAQLDPELESRAEAETGLRLPEDLQTLLGEGVALAVDSSLDPAAFQTLGFAGDELPVGLRIVGDPSSIVPVLDRLVAASGAQGEEIVVREGDDAVAVGLSEAYVDQLAAGGDLGSSESFEQSLPGYQENAAAFFVDFDSGEWFTAPDAELQSNLEPMSSLGATMTVEDEVVRAQLRLDLD